jgi:hypothetical protein
VGQELSESRGKRQLNVFVQDEQTNSIASTYYVATGTCPHSTTHFSPLPSSPGRSIKLSNLPSLNNCSNSSRLSFRACGPQDLMKICQC